MPVDDLKITNGIYATIYIPEYGEEDEWIVKHNEMLEKIQSIDERFIGFDGGNDATFEPDCVYVGIPYERMKDNETKVELKKHITEILCDVVGEWVESDIQETTEFGYLVLEGRYFGKKF